MEAVRAEPASARFYDQLSRDLALAASRADAASRVNAAVQMLANIRDFLVADLSGAAEARLDEAITELM